MPGRAHGPLAAVARVSPCNPGALPV